MQKGKEKTRDIKFFSEKNQTMICVHTPEAREYAKSLEEQSGIKNYETNRVLELEHFSHVNPVGIRPDYFKTVWVSDFFCATPTAVWLSGRSCGLKCCRSGQ